MVLQALLHALNVQTERVSIIQIWFKFLQKQPAWLMTPPYDASPGTKMVAGMTLLAVFAIRDDKGLEASDTPSV